MTLHVYTFWSSEGEPLYIGCTGALAERMKQHEGRRWAREAVYISVVPFADRTKALEFEALQIFASEPKYNVHYNPRHWPAIPEEDMPSAIARRREAVRQLLDVEAVA